MLQWLVTMVSMPFKGRGNNSMKKTMIMVITLIIVIVLLIAYTIYSAYILSGS